MAEKAKQAATEAKTNKKDQADKADIEKNKGMAMIAYIIFFIPLLTDAKDSKFAKFHTNQGFVLFLFALIGNVVGTFIPFIGWFLVLPIVAIATIIFFVLGLINASKGEMKELPLIGGIHLLDK